MISTEFSGLFYPDETQQVLGANLHGQGSGHHGLDVLVGPTTGRQYTVSTTPRLTTAPPRFWHVPHRRNMRLTSFPLISVRQDGYVTLWKSRWTFISSATSRLDKKSKSWPTLWATCTLILLAWSYRKLAQIQSTVKRAMTESTTTLLPGRKIH